MVNYKQGKIYRIEPIIQDFNPNDVYYGSTVEQLPRRFTDHKSDYRSQKRDSASVKILFDKYGEEKCRIILVENVEAETKCELLCREAFYIQNNLCVNKVVPLRTKEEYFNLNAEKLQEEQKKYQEQYRINNREKLRKKKKEAYQKNKIKILKQKKEREQNLTLEEKEKIRNYQKQYRSNHKKK